MKYLKTITVLFITLALLFFVSCLKEEESRTSQDELNELADYLVANDIDAIPTWTGLYYLEDSVGEGVKPEYNDTVVIDFHASLLTGATLGSSELTGEPFTFTLWDWGIIMGLSEAISYTNEGGMAQAIIPSPLAFGPYGTGIIEPYSTILYDFELIEVRPGNPVEPYPEEDSSFHTTTSGLQYYIVEQSEGALVQPGNTVTVDYTGYLSSGKIFDSSVKRDTPAEFTVGVGNMIPGFDEGLQLMKVGEKFRFIIQPDLAYGEPGNFPVIPPNSTITFDVEVLDTTN